MSQTDGDILFVCSVEWGGGAEVVMTTLLSALAAAGHPVGLVILNKSARTLDFSAAPFTVYRLYDQKSPPVTFAGRVVRGLRRRARWMFGHRDLFSRLSRFCRDALPEPLASDKRLDGAVRRRLSDVEKLLVLLGRFDRPPLLVPIMEEATLVTWLTAHCHPVPFIASLHSVVSANLRLVYPDPDLRAVETALLLRACADARAVTVPLPEGVADLRDALGYRAENLHAVANPLPVERIRRRATEPFERSLPDFGDRRVLVCIGRLSPEKGQHHLLRAAAELRRRRSDFVVALLGDGWYRPELERLAAELEVGDCVRFLGEVANPFPLLARSHALVLASEAESFGLVLVEAMVCGVPVLAVDCPTGPRAILGADSQHGLLIPDHSPDQICAAIEAILDDSALHARYAASGPLRAAAFELDAVIPAWDALLQNGRNR